MHAGEPRAWSGRPIHPDHVPDGELRRLGRTADEVKQGRAGGDHEPVATRVLRVAGAERATCVEVQHVLAHQHPSAAPVPVQRLDVVAGELGNLPLRRRKIGARIDRHAKHFIDGEIRRMTEGPRTNGAYLPFQAGPKGSLAENELTPMKHGVLPIGSLFLRIARNADCVLNSRLDGGSAMAPGWRRAVVPPLRPVLLDQAQSPRRLKRG
jgi:hypothetical protein